jgi:hypothetical protein
MFVKFILYFSHVEFALCKEINKYIYEPFDVSYIFRYAIIFYFSFFISEWQLK